MTPCSRLLIVITLATWGGEPYPAVASEAPAPLVLAPAPAPPTAPGPLDVAVDFALPAALGWLAWRGLQAASPSLGPDTGLGAGLSSGALGGAIAACVAVPPAALVALRERPFPLDMAAASATGGIVGLGVGFGAARLLAPGDPTWLVTGLAVGQGLGAAAAYHLYRAEKHRATDLDRLPTRRTDDPIDNWKFWRERRTP